MFEIDYNFLMLCFINSMLIRILCKKIKNVKNWFQTFQTFWLKCKTSSFRRLIANINWLELELQFNMLIIQTNRCFIKSKIRDLLCTRRLSIEIFSDYRISLINNLFVIFTVLETKIYETFLITSFDAYIEVCSLKFEHQCRAIVFSFLIWIVASRLLDFDLNRYIIFFQRNRSFMKFMCLTFTNRRRTFSNITRWWRRRFVTFSRNLLSKAISKVMIRRKIWKKKIWRWFI